MLRGTAPLTSSRLGGGMGNLGFAGGHRLCPYILSPNNKRARSGSSALSTNQWNEPNRQDSPAGVRSPVWVLVDQHKILN